MNYYFLVDDFDNSIDGILVSERSAEEIQNIVNEVRYKDHGDNYLMSEVIDALPKDVEVIRVWKAIYY